MLKVLCKVCCAYLLLDNLISLGISKVSELLLLSPCAAGLRVKTNLLSMKAGRLGQALSRFVREVRRPNGERYTPDSILYLCLGIQKVRCWV